MVEARSWLGRPSGHHCSRWFETPAPSKIHSSTQHHPPTSSNFKERESTGSLARFKKKIALGALQIGTHNHGLECLDRWRRWRSRSSHVGRRGSIAAVRKMHRHNAWTFGTLQVNLDSFLAAWQLMDQPSTLFHPPLPSSATGDGLVLASAFHLESRMSAPDPCRRDDGWKRRDQTKSRCW